MGGLATPLYPRHSKLVDYVLDGLSWDGGDFRAYRFTLAYLPIPTVALMRAKLPLRTE